MSDDEVFLSIEQVCAKINLSKAEIARREAAGVFPTRIALPGASGKIYQNSRRVFLQSKIVAWMRQQVEAAHGTDVPSS